MKRSELYEKVWSAPMTRLAKQLGISDVGLAKACRRHDVPAPPRGYWAKLAAGHKPPRTPLPNPKLDVEVHFTTLDPNQLARQRAIESRRAELLSTSDASAKERAPIVFATDLKGAHPLVGATRRYCDRLPRLIERAKRNWGKSRIDTKPEDRPPPEQHGRYHLIHQGCLDINASLASMDWILRFHATLLRSLSDGGMKIVRLENTEATYARHRSGPAIEMRLGDETFSLKFSEGYRRIRLFPAEVAEKRKESSWASEYETKPSGNFTFSIQGTEYQASKTWQGTHEKLQGLLDEIVRTALLLPALQMRLRKERKASEADQQRAAEARAREQRRSEAHAEQLKQAFLMMEADARVQQLKSFLDRLEQRADDLQPPYDDRLKIWLKVVRNELAARNPVDEILSRCVAVPSWTTWPPAWWPIDIKLDIVD
ncbi:hypothetical protein [Paraburkholderia sp. BCC1885]|uniref:hypothetical protein n=1 Tax=Paraburkholderia sp. BCC1885 TaxID=2562669 RepID=UPI0011843A88|nr:hypothetical protein [Paraburkholderia sp. BCC1885]